MPRRKNREGHCYPRATRRFLVSEIFRVIIAAFPIRPTIGSGIPGTETKSIEKHANRGWKENGKLLLMLLWLSVYSPLGRENRLAAEGILQRRQQQQHLRPEVQRGKTSWENKVEAADASQSRGERGNRKWFAWKNMAPESNWKVEASSANSMPGEGFSRWRCTSDSIRGRGSRTHVNGRRSPTAGREDAPGAIPSSLRCCEPDRPAPEIVPRRNRTSAYAPLET